jgi:hypothetical protein
LVEESRDREIHIQKANKEVLDTFNEHAKQFEVEKASVGRRASGGRVWLGGGGRSGGQPFCKEVLDTFNEHAKQFIVGKARGPRT